MKILLIISASIAIKKCYEIINRLSSNQIIIDCILTDNAQKMIKIKKLKQIVNGNIFTNQSETKQKMLHINLSRKNDLIIVCPATANIIAKFANGYANDLASTSLIASNKQIIVIPAMNSEMWKNPINQKNIKKLKNYGVEFIGPVHGRLACGEIGLGRLSNSTKISNIINDKIKKINIFKNKKCLITAGPTVEPIDSIRYLTNHSSGKQGYEIAQQMILSGAKVILVSGPTNLEPPFNSKIIKVKTANEMFKAVKKNLNVDIAIFTAAVADVSPQNILKSKIKKNKLTNIKLKKNKDILYEVATLKKNRPKIVIGFAAETNNHINNAKKKLLNKNCDAIVVNKIDKKNQVFGSDFNKVSFVTKKTILNFNKTSKINVAKKVIRLIDSLQ